MKKTKKSKKAVVVIKKLSAVLLCFVILLTVLSVTGIVPEMRMIPGIVKVGADYITLKYNKDAVSADGILEKAENINISHPFILADENAFNLAREEYESDSFSAYTRELSEYVFLNADALLDKSMYPPMEYVLDEEDSILPISRETINRIVILGYAYRISGDEKYAERARDELLNVCSYPDWCLSHFLATAEMALAVSIGYDWLYDYLTDEEKSILAEKTWEYAIYPASSKNYLKNWFTWSKNNWNSICYSGIGIACMTFFENDAEAAAEFLSMCYKNMPIAFENFTPDGVYAEGPGYSESGTNSIVYFMQSSLNYFGTDFGLSSTDGFSELGSFPIYISSSEGVFNFGDNKDRMYYSPTLHWYAATYERPLLSVYQTGKETGEFTADSSDSTERNGNGRENVLSLLWYNRNYTEASSDFSDEPLSICLCSDAGQELCIMRSSYTDENATYAAIKGGYNYINHGDLDIGTFVFDSMGERWAEELGPGAYDAPGYFTALPFGGRWKMYCKRAEGQNTIVINPTDKREDQYVFAVAEFSSFEETEDGGKCVLDMTDAYSMQRIKSAVREFELYNDRTSLRISDSIECAKNSDIYWFMHTKAEISVSSDGRTAILTKNGRQMKATLSGDGVFTVSEPVSFNGKYEYDDDYSDIKKLTVFIENAKTAEITVSLEPVM